MKQPGMPNVASRAALYGQLLRVAFLPEGSATSFTVALTTSEFPSACSGRGLRACQGDANLLPECSRTVAIGSAESPWASPR